MSKSQIWAKEDESEAWEAFYVWACCFGVGLFSFQSKCPSIALRDTYGNETITCRGVTIYIYIHICISIFMFFCDMRAHMVLKYRFSIDGFMLCVQASGHRDLVRH